MLEQNSGHTVCTSTIPSALYCSRRLHSCLCRLTSKRLLDNRLSAFVSAGREQSTQTFAPVDYKFDTKATLFDELAEKDEKTCSSATGTDRPDKSYAKRADPQQPSELQRCRTVGDVLEVLEENSSLISGHLVAVALHKCVTFAKKRAQLNKKQMRQSLTSLGKSSSFQTLLALVLDTAPEMSPSDLGIVMWSLATMNMKGARALRLLQKQIDLEADRMNAHDLAMTAWAFATLNHNPGALLDRLATAATPILDSFKPQGLSMMLWAYGKLDHAPPSSFVGELRMKFDQNMHNFSSQSVANIIYALGKLQLTPKYGVCKRVEDRIAKEPEKFKDIELANTLFGFVKSRYQCWQLIGMIERRVAARSLNEQTQSVTWATLIWGAGSLAMQLKPETFQAFEDWGFSDPAAFEPLSATNIAWGMAMLGEVRRPAFGRVVEAVVAAAAVKGLEPRLMRQLHQAVVSARLLGVAVPVPADLEASTSKWWRKAVHGFPMSMSHEAVAKAISRLDLESQAQFDPGHGLPLVDVAIFPADGSKVALQVGSYNETTLGTKLPLGRVVHNAKLLESLGWKVALLQTCQLPPIENQPAVLRMVGSFLSSVGVDTNWQSVLDNVPRPIPAAVRASWAQERVSMPLAASSPPSARQAENEAPLPTLQGSAHHDRDSGPLSASPAGLNGVQRRSQRKAARDIAGQPKEEDIAEDSSTRSSNRAGNSDMFPSGSDNVSDLSEQEKKEKELRTQLWQTEVSRSLSGDFMEDWVELSEWKSARKVLPS